MTEKLSVEFSALDEINRFLLDPNNPVVNALLQDKHDAVNRTAEVLTEKGLSFITACNLHRR